MAPLEACFCAEIPLVRSRVRVVVVRHRSERKKVSNTGALAARVIGGKIVEHSSEALVAAGLGDTPHLLFPFAAERATWPQPSALVVLDGTWAQARRMRARLPELARMPVLTLPVDGVSGPRMRERRLPECVSTIEAIAAALVRLDDPEPAAALRGLSDRMNALWMRLRRVPNASPMSPLTDIDG